MKPKKVSESSIDKYPYHIFPNDLNSYRTAFGGRVLEIADRLAGYVARSHSGKICVTLLLDSVRFLAPAREGETLIFRAAVNRSWRTSLEVGVKVCAENTQTRESRHVASMYFTFVAMDENMLPTGIPPVEPETNEEKRRYEEAGARRQRRLAESKKQSG